MPSADIRLSVAVTTAGWLCPVLETRAAPCFAGSHIPRGVTITQRALDIALSITGLVVTAP